MHRILHVLPHPGGGGETYVRLLSGIEGYSFETVFLAPSANRPAAVPVNALAAQWAARGARLIHVHGEVAAVACLPALALKPAVVTLHGLHLLRRADGVARDAAASSLALVLRAASRTICVAQSEYADVIGAVGEWASPRLAVIVNGVPLPAPPGPDERRKARALWGIGEEAFVGAWLGGLDEHKDPLTAARAARQAQVLLIFAGEGPLQAGVREEGGPWVRMLGHRGDVRSVLAAADFFVLPSRREGLSFALLEAMALGVAPVVSDAPGNVEAVGDAGLIVPAGDVAGFAAAFGSGERLQALGARARARVASRFRVDEMRRLTAEVYRAAIGA